MTDSDTTIDMQNVDELRQQIEDLKLELLRVKGHDEWLTNQIRNYRTGFKMYKTCAKKDKIKWQEICLIAERKIDEELNRIDESIADKRQTRIEFPL